MIQPRKKENGNNLLTMGENLRFIIQGIHIELYFALKCLTKVSFFCEAFKWE